MARSERYALKRDREIFPVRCALVSFILIISEKEKAAKEVGCSGRLHTLPRDPAVQPAPSFYDFYL